MKVHFLWVFFAFLSFGHRDPFSVSLPEQDVHMQLVGIIVGEQPDLSFACINYLGETFCVGLKETVGDWRLDAIENGIVELVHIKNCSTCLMSLNR